MCRLHFVFKCSTQGTFESMVKMVAGPMIHVDAVPQGDGERAGKAYTCYMFETFSENDCVYRPGEYTSLTLDITPEEHDKVVGFFKGCVDRKIPYNYKDMLLCKTPARKYMTELTDEPACMFCSQAMTLCLKKCIKSNERLAELVGGLNSRTTTPQALYEVLFQFRASDDPLHCDLPQVGAI